MRNVEKFPRILRRILKAVTSSRARKHLHELDYQIGQLISTYQHHIDLSQVSTWSGRFKSLMLTTRLLAGRKQILCYPDLPGPGSVFYKLCLHLGHAVTDDPDEPFDVALKWKNATYSSNGERISNIASKARVLNLGVTNISKGRVAEAFEEVFGYALSVNPLTYNGPILKKSEVNAAHDGEIVQAPLEHASDGYAYQRLINNTKGDVAVDLRVPIFCNEIPFVRVKHRPIEKRFDHAGRSQVHDEVKSVEDVLSSKEQARILALCREMGLDYGELDVLRDRDTKRVYVVDVNNTPTGPTFVAADQKTIRWCFDAMAKALQTCLFGPDSLRY